jgi:hypothetical protein
MARRRKIFYSGKRWGKGAGWELKMTGNMLLEAEGRSVRMPIEKAAAESVEMVNLYKKNVGYKIIGRYGSKIIAANKLQKAVNSIGKKKIKDKLQELYNAGVRRKFRERGSTISRWLPLARSTVQSRTGLLKPYGSNKKSGGVRPLWDTGKLRNVVSEGFYVTDANIYNVQEIKGDKLVFDNIDVGMKFIDRGGSARAAYKNRKGFATFKELMEHQSRWRNIPLTTGKRGERFGSSSGNLQVLQHSDVTKGEFFHYVWLPFARWWGIRLKESLGKLHRSPILDILTVGKMMREAGVKNLSTSTAEQQIKEAFHGKDLKKVLGLVMPEKTSKSVKGGGSPKLRAKGVVGEKFTGSEEQLARIIKHFKIDPDIANQMTEDWAEKLWIKMKGERS